MTTHINLSDLTIETRKEKNEADICSAGKRLAELSELGHFLKGSSATLGLVKVKDDCERIQHCQEDVGDNLDDPKILDTIKGYITDAQDNHREVEVILRRFYGESIESPPAAAAASTATPTPAAAPSSTTSATAAAAAAAAGAPTPAGAAGTGTAAAASVPAGAGAGKQSPEGGGTGKEEKLTEKSVK